MNKLAFLIAFFCLNSAFSQTGLKKKLTGNWTLTDIKLVDGSKIFDPEVKQTKFDVRILPSDSVLITLNSKTHRQAFKLKDSVITWGGMSLKIKSIDEVSFVADQLVSADNQEPLNLKFVLKKLNDLTFTPQSYVAKNGDEVYIFEPGKIEPLFVDSHRSPLDFIVEKFDFSEFRKGGFVVRFVVTKTGEVAGVRVVASSNEKFDKKLINSVYLTKGKWIPAEYLGEKVTVEVEYDLNLGWTDENATANIEVDSVAYSDEYYSAGQGFFEYKQYRLAEQNYTKAIGYNPLNINAYFQRAATYMILKKKDEACKDYQQLIFLEQSKAKALYDKYCLPVK